MHFLSISSMIFDLTDPFLINFRSFWPLIFRKLDPIGSIFFITCWTWLPKNWWSTHSLLRHQTNTQRQTIGTTIIAHCYYTALPYHILNMLLVPVVKQIQRILQYHQWFNWNLIYGEEVIYLLQLTDITMQWQ